MGDANLPDISKSYLNILEDRLVKENVTIYGIQNYDIIPIKYIHNKDVKHDIVVVQMSPRQLGSIKRLIPEIIAKLKPGGRLHLLLEPLHPPIAHIIFILAYYLIKREVSKYKWRYLETYGIRPDPWSPDLIVPFSKNIYKYVMTVAYRYLDTPIRSFVKKIIVSLLGFWTWKDYIVIVCSLNKNTQPLKYNGHI